MTGFDTLNALAKLFTHKEAETMTNDFITEFADLLDDMTASAETETEGSRD